MTTLRRALFLAVFSLPGILVAQGGDQRGKGARPIPVPGKGGPDGVVRGPGILSTTADGAEAAAENTVPPNPDAVALPSLRPEEHFTAFASLRPRRLAPGQSGNLYVVVTLRSDSVVLPDAFINLEMKPAGTPLVLGSPVRTPARSAAFAERFRGKKVYDNTIEFLIPAQVSAEAEKKEYFINGTIEMDITRASSGDVVGRVKGNLSGRVKIGEPLPTPVVKRRPRRAEPKAGVEEVVQPNVAGSVSTGDPSPEKLPADAAPSAGELESADSRTEPTQDAGDPVNPGRGPSMFFLLGGGVGLLVLVGLLLLVCRRR